MVRVRQLWVLEMNDGKGWETTDEAYLTRAEGRRALAGTKAFLLKLSEGTRCRLVQYFP